MRNLSAPGVLDDEEKTFQSTVLRFARERIAPHVRAMDESAVFRKDLLQEMFELGLMGVEIPEEFGGQGGSFFQSVLAVEALAAVDPSAAVIVDVQNTIANNILLRWGNEDQKRCYLPRLAADTVASFALSEAGAGSDAFALTTRATRDGDHFHITGRKLWITNAAEAGIFFVFANADPAQGYRGITCFLIDRETTGFKVGKKEDKLGIRASSTCELILDDCPVPSGNVVGEVGKGYKIAIETLNEGRVAIGGQMTGLAQGSARRHAVAYAETAPAVRQTGYRRIPRQSNLHWPRWRDRRGSRPAPGLQRRAPARCRQALRHRSCHGEIIRFTNC